MTISSRDVFRGTICPLNMSNPNSAHVSALRRLSAQSCSSVSALSSALLRMSQGNDAHSFMIGLADKTFSSSVATASSLKQRRMMNQRSPVKFQRCSSSAEAKSHCLSQLTKSSGLAKQHISQLAIRWSFDRFELAFSHIDRSIGELGQPRARVRTAWLAQTLPALTRDSRRS
jgi:hypothetical protein